MHIGHACFEVHVEQVLETLLSAASMLVHNREKRHGSHGTRLDLSEVDISQGEARQRLEQHT